MDGKTVVAMSLLFCLPWPCAYGGSVQVPGIGGQITMDVVSFQEQRFSTIMRQEYDYSCGSAALASLLSFHYGQQVTEHAVFESMLANADKDKVRQEGFSMLDMKRYLAGQGYRADGFRLSLSGLRQQVGLPLIVLMNVDGFRHFVVVKGISDQDVLVGDPARGLKVYSRDAFARQWDGIAFAIRNQLTQGRGAFNRREDWQQVARAPVYHGGDPNGQSLGYILPQWSSSIDW
ncbi:C39 family peptidase [Marinobacter caseinilyticus]|uniref:C39 family peptidase n=1 Tax=Marinobacter caseinilyticus TaxID=2692195 RepID=UPI001F3B9FFF|nr:C39 family peptidase [Marinobacter caseinilyticus]